MPTRIALIMEKVNQRQNLTPAEAGVLADKITTLSRKHAACAEEVSRRDKVEKSRRREARELVERARAAEEDADRLRESLRHARNQKSVETAALEDRVKFLENILRDVHFGLLYQSEQLTRENIASTIADIVDPHPRPLD